MIIFGPWWLSLVRDLIAERQARALAEERAQMAAHVHDSVLQTLALIQRSADDPQNVVRLARAQERELRAWLFEGRPPGAIGEDATMLAEGVGLLQRQVEADHGITVQVVMVGDCELDEALRALLDAAREATVNAAKWSGADQVSLYAEVEADTVMLYVRDRGRGFDPDAVPEDRQGIAQSIRARMARFGGTAVIRSAPGEGAEVQLSMPRRRTGQVSAGRAAAGRPPRIFLVEDHAVFRAGVKAELGDAVEVVGEADEAGAAIELINERLPDVVLLDVHLPGGGGHAVLRGVLPAPSRGAVPRPLGLGRARGRHRRHPGRRPRLHHQDDLGPRAAPGRLPGGRRRRRLLAPTGRLRARRLRPRAAPRRPPGSTPSSTSSRRASARCCG